MSAWLVPFAAGFLRRRQRWKQGFLKGVIARDTDAVSDLFYDYATLMIG